MKTSVYLKLMRFDKPVGIWLLWSPTAWALSLANHGNVSLPLFSYFFLGTVIMRAAGCIINDIADRHIDLQVMRTQNRPLTTGQVGLIEALALLSGLLVSALIILLQLPPACFVYALTALVITAVYPFGKRYIQAPQLVLGLAFSMGIPMAYAASNARFDENVVMLWLINFLWVIAYDTIYALMDMPDDQRIGVHSTAIFFGKYVNIIIQLLYLSSHCLWLLLAWKNNFNHLFYCLWLVGGFILLYQRWIMAYFSAANQLYAFTANGWYGITMWFAIIAGYCL